LSLLISLLGAGVITANAASILLYDIDFGTPPHSVGNLPTTGVGPIPRDTISEIKFGNPFVVASFSDLTDQPLRFDNTDPPVGALTSSDQIQLNLNGLPSNNCYTLESEVVITSTLTSGRIFTIFFDTPTFRAVEFNADGTIDANVFSVSDVPIGNYVDGTKINVKVFVDLAADNWKIFLNDLLSHDGTFGGSTQINTIRFSTPTGGSLDVQAGIDNVLVSVGCPLVGGDLIPLDTTALLLAGTYSTAAWMIPVIVSAIGIGIVIARKF